MRISHGIWLAVALVGSATAGGFDPGRRGGPDNTASARSEAEASTFGAQATFDDLATEIAWLEGNVWAPHTNILTRRCDRRRPMSRSLRRLDRQLERLADEIEGFPRQTWRVDEYLPLEPPPPLPPQTSWLGVDDP